MQYSYTTQLFFSTASTRLGGNCPQRKICYPYFLGNFCKFPKLSFHRRIRFDWGHKWPRPEGAEIRRLGLGSKTNFAACLVAHKLNANTAVVTVPCRWMESVTQCMTGHNYWQRICWLLILLRLQLVALATPWVSRLPLATTTTTSRSLQQFVMSDSVRRNRRNSAEVCWKSSTFPRNTAYYLFIGPRKYERLSWPS